MDLKTVKKIKWHYLINRREPLLFHSIADNSSKFFSQLTGLDWQLSSILRLGGGEYFIGKDDLDKFTHILLAGDIKLFKRFSKSLILNVSKLDNFTKQSEHSNSSKLTKKELLFDLNRYIQLAFESNCFLTPMPMMDKLISEKILDSLPNNNENKKQELLRALTFPEKESEHTKEARSFYQLCILYKLGHKDFKKRLLAHLNKFQWIGARIDWTKAWAESDIMTRIENFFTENKNPKKELLHLDSLRNVMHKKADILCERLNIKKNSELYDYILLAREFAFLRTWRTDVIYRSFYKASKIFTEISRRAGLKNPNDSMYLTFYELVKMAKTNRLSITNKELNGRKKFYVTIYLENTYLVESGRKSATKYKFIDLLKPVIGKSLKGNVAYPGKVKGRVRIVKKDEDLSKVERGDILVAIMTFPHFVPAMEKAAAFVTDEGGILCHAAIVSREMKKPCIIATKNATTVLRDGDLVVVDANKGMVKIIK